MLTTSAPLRRWKRWLPLPAVAGLILLLASCEKDLEHALPPPPPPALLEASPNAGGSADADARLMPPPPPPPAPYSYVEQMPEYEGGMDQMMADLGENLTYPPGAVAAKVEGRAFVKFVVGTDGRIQAVDLQKSAAKPGTSAELARQLDEAALDAVRKLPGKWTPGRQNGQAVPVYFTVPIQFAVE